MVRCRGRVPEGGLERQVPRLERHLPAPDTLVARLALHTAAHRRHDGASKDPDATQSIDAGTQSLTLKHTVGVTAERLERIPPKKTTCSVGFCAPADKIRPRACPLTPVQSKVVGRVSAPQHENAPPPDLRQVLLG